MDDTLAPNVLSSIGDVLAALFALSLSAPLEVWERGVVRALASLTGADDVTLVLQGGETIGPLAAGVSAGMVRGALRAPNAPAIPDDIGHSPYRAYAWCRPATTTQHVPHRALEAVAGVAADGAAYEAVGMTAELGLPGVFATAVCRLSPHRDAIQTQRRLELLRSLLPAFASAARVRTSAAGTRRLAARLLEASGASALLFAGNGEALYATTALTRLLGGDPARDLVREEMAQLVRTFLTDRPATRQGDAEQRTLATDSCTVETTHGRYVLRCCEIPPEEPGPPALVATTIELVATIGSTADPLEGAASTLRTRYGLTTRELDVARLLLAGKPNAEVARQLGISEFTARRHTEHVLEKLGVRSRAEVPAVLHAHLAPPRAGDA